MRDKVWTIEDPFDKTEARTEASSELKSDKNPAVAFSLSILIWGGGQFYTGYWIEGAILFLFMLGFYSFSALELFFRDSDSLKSFVIPFHHQIWLPLFMILYFAGLAIWLFGSVRAYFLAAAERNERYQGVKQPLVPALCSLLVPGWGQFLNGQTKKGLFFLLIGFIGFFSVGVIPSIFFFWDDLGQSIMKADIEKVLAGCILSSPVVLLFWMCGIYDAFIICKEEVKKEPLLMRMSYALNRLKLKGWKESITPRLKLLSILLIFFTISILVAYRYTPKSFYLEEMARTSNELKARQMTILPELIDRSIKEIRRL